MGGGSSRSTAVEASELSVSTLPSPVTRDDCMLFSVVPMEEDLKKRGATLLLEVGNEGFRLLRPGTQEPINLFPWGQIHSWAHGDCKFTFRYFDDGKRTILLHNLSLRDVNELLDHIQGIIDVILAERKKSAISSEAYEALLESVAAADPVTQQQLIKQASAGATFTSEQGRGVLDLLPTTFDKVEAAVVLHGRLIDQNRFSYMLETLDCQGDRDNVWHRITLMKKSSPSSAKLR